MTNPSAIEPITGVSAVNARGEVLLFTRPLDRRPSWIEKDGDVITIRDAAAPLSRETYGRLCSETVARTKRARILEVAENGEPVRETEVDLRR